MKRYFLLLTLFLIGLATMAQGTRLVILHTNDTHSQVEPTDNNMGGYARRLGVINHIRRTEPNVLLVDAGDFLQGTPYFNFYGGRIEVDALNRMQYDAVTLGNHEFDNGLDSLALILQKNKVPLVSANYDFRNTPLNGLVKPYHIVQRGGLRIGIFGLGINPEGLVFQNNYKGMVFNDPIAVADSIALLLRTSEKCDLVICLSHLGSDPKNSPVNDVALAGSSRYIDVIIGGHTHQLITETAIPNADGRPVILAQMGKSGQYLGRIDLVVEKQKKRRAQSKKVR